jgi:(p)ppGpp synthase/HD superfamily hydrolase
MMADPILGERFNDALVYAATLHRPQVRKETTIPYVSHLLAVAGIVLEHGGDEDEAIGALLHDAGEDCGGEEQIVEIAAMFGEDVAHIVRGCSDSLLPQGEEKIPWRARKAAYIEHVATACAPVRLVSAADKLHNARSILSDYRIEGAKLWRRFNKESNQLWYYEKLVDAFRKHGDHTKLIDELSYVVGELRQEMTQRGEMPSPQTTGSPRRAPQTSAGGI